MDVRIPRIRRKLATVPFQALRSRSFGEEHHQFRLDQPLDEARIAAFESEHAVTLPDAYRQFLLYLGGSGAGPYYGLMPLESCTLYVPQPSSVSGMPRGFDEVISAEDGDLFLHIIEMGCADICLLALRGPLTGRVVTGNSDGFWGPDVSSASDFLAWYEQWLDRMAQGRGDNAFQLTAP